MIGVRLFTTGRDRPGYSSDRLASMGIGSCICCLVIVNEGKAVFIEHQNGLSFPTNFNKDNIHEYFQDLSYHVNQLLPKSSIR
jgi:hypothetical protein